MPDIVYLIGGSAFILVAANAFLHAPRVAEARDMDPETLLQLLEDATIQGGSGMLETRP
jgi:hypothetical protein